MKSWRLLPMFLGFAFLVPVFGSGCGSSGEAEKPQLKQPAVTSSKDVPNISSDIDKIRSGPDAILDQITKSAREQDQQNREKNKAEADKSKKELDAQEAGRAKRDAFVKNQTAEAKRKEKANAEANQAELQKLADQHFGNVSFDPVKCVILSPSLKKSGATVQIVGRKYKEISAFHAKKDWLGLINFLNEHDPSKGYRSGDDVLKKFFNLGSGSDYKLQLLVTTKLDLRQASDDSAQLFALQFPLTVDLSAMYSRSASTERDYSSKRPNATHKFFPAAIDYSSNFTKHPEGTGYFCAWTPLQLVLVGLDSKLEKNQFDRLARKYHVSVIEDFMKKETQLRVKQDLGELTEDEIRKQLTLEMVRLYGEAKKWLEKF